jgi:hypothetical protein
MTDCGIKDQTLPLLRQEVRLWGNSWTVRALDARSLSEECDAWLSSELSPPEL